MATARTAAECPDCRQICEQDATGFRLYRCTDRVASDFYTFTCPACGLAAAKPADVHVVALLIAGRVQVIRTRTPLELADPRRRAGRALGWDDVLDFLGNLQVWDGGVDAAATRVDRTGEGATTAGA